MKYILYISIIIILASCGSTESLVVKPEYTTTNSIYSLNVGMSESEVIKKLGLSPYDITYNLSKDTKVLVWKYKRPYHQIKRPLKGAKSSLSSGSERFLDDLKLFVHFTNGKLVRFYTDSGISDSQKLFNAQHNLETITR
tara:strand:+ start:14 stop:433 length:420 start_codon:yes stop_codon:yes gene_type:complete